MRKRTTRLRLFLDCGSGDFETGSGCARSAPVEPRARVRHPRWQTRVAKNGAAGFGRRIGHLGAVRRERGRTETVAAPLAARHFDRKRSGVLYGRVGVCRCGTRLWPLHPDARLIVLTGFLGAFTTYSALILETGQLLQNQGWRGALGYLGLQLALGALACGAAWALIRALT